MTSVALLVALQIVLGGLDSLWHHELRERLAQRRSARLELLLHSAREFIYALLFAVFAWRIPAGNWVWVLALLLAFEIVITVADFLVEDRTRKLPSTERVLHTVLAINFGAILATLAPHLGSWSQLSTALIPVSHGWVSWCLTAASVGVAAWGVRNLLAAVRFYGPAAWESLPEPSAFVTRTVLITGATGFIGGHLCRRLLERGYAVVVLTRDYDRAWERFGPRVRIVTALAEIAAEDRIDTVVNLAGARIFGLPWTKARRRTLLDSRLRTTAAVVALIERLQRKPSVLVSASAIGYYGVRGNEEISEADRGQPIFQSHLCQAWELAAQRAERFGVRVCRIRLGLVLGMDGGVLPQQAFAARMRLRVIFGSGDQWLSWIHVHDAVALIEHCIDRDDVRGPLNATAPQPVRQHEFSAALVPVGSASLPLTIPERVVRTGLGEMAQLLVDGQRVLPLRALSSGFVFRYPTLGQAVRDLLFETERAGAHEHPLRASPS